MDTKSNFLNPMILKNGDKEFPRLVAKEPVEMGDSTLLLVANQETGVVAAMSYTKARGKNPDMPYLPKAVIYKADIKPNNQKVEDTHPDAYATFHKAGVAFSLWQLASGGYSFRPRKFVTREVQVNCDLDF